MVLHIEYMKEKELEITGNCEVTVVIPCDRCLTDVTIKIPLEIHKRVSVASEEVEETDELDETNYIDGYNFDVEQLIYNELLIGWPMKILCSEDCEGICNVCGQNLNEGTCNCEIHGLTRDADKLSAMCLRILRRCNLCQFVQRINLLKQEETKEERIGR